MNVTITEKEYDALIFAVGQIEGDLEAATNEDYIHEAETCVVALDRIIEKYRKARYNANYFQTVRAEVSRHNRNMRPRDIDKMTRKIIKKMKENEKDNVQR